jgi:phosphoglucomutase
MALCEAAAYYKSKGITLWDQMINIYEKYGYYREGQTSITMKGADGAEKIKTILDNMRANPPKQIGQYKVIEYRDYKNKVVENYAENKTGVTDLPESNVLYFQLENDAWCCVRPSGTEPKIKFYIGVKSDSLENSEKELNDLAEAMKKFE